jgi:glycogen synthase
MMQHYLSTTAQPISLHIGIECDRGGAGRVISELMTHLPQAGVEFRGIVANPPEGREGHETLRAFSSPQAGLLNRLGSARTSIRAALNDFKPDIIASHFAMYSAPGMDILKNRPMISHFHGPWSDESVQEGGGNAAAAAKSYVERYVYKRSQRVIVLSTAFADLVTARFGVDPDRVRLVPGSVDTERFAIRTSRCDSRAMLGLPLDRPILVTVRRLVNRMGLSSLVDAMRQVVAAVPDVLLCVAGQGLLRRPLEAQVERLGLARHIQFLGFVLDRDLPHLYHAADINVVPTVALEGFGLVAAEAMATGTPSMVTAIGGLPEVVGELSSDMIFSGTTSGDIAEGLVSALKGAIRLPTRAECRDYVGRKFNSRLMALRTAAVYRELMV